MQRQNTEKVKRGEIYLHNFGDNTGSIQNGIRPVLVVQCDEGNQTSTTTIVAALTSVIKKRYIPSHIILGDKFGLKEPSMVMFEQLKTVNQSELVEYIGFVDSEYLLYKINCGLKKTLGLWVDKQYCIPHTIRENQIDELVENEVKSLRDNILAESDKYDKIIRDWLRKKPLYEQQIQMNTEKILALKQQIEDLIMERIGDREHASIYNNMIA